jgi:hypothetical protein
MTRRLLTLAVGLIAVACTEAGPTNPTLAPPSSSVHFVGTAPGQLLSVHTVNWPGNHSSQYSVSGLITAAGGGTLTIPEAGFTISFPAGALNQDIQITIIALSGASVAYDMFPHGLRFNKPVIATQAIPAGSGRKGGAPIFCAYLDSAHENIGANGVALAAEIELSFTDFDAFANPIRSRWYLNHFSRYILASGDTGGSTATADSSGTM